MGRSSTLLCRLAATGHWVLLRQRPNDDGSFLIEVFGRDTLNLGAGDGHEAR